MKLIQNIRDYGELLEIKPKLLSLSENSERGLITAKYSKRAFYNQSWNKYPMLLQARGHTFDLKTGDIVTRPFDKVFNYSENDVGLDLDPNKKVLVIEKINGFLGAVTVTHFGKLIIQTSGATKDNNYHKMIHDLFDPIETEFLEWVGGEEGYTFLFEVVHPDDPHIVPEKVGLHYLASRQVETGKLSPLPPEGTIDIPEIHVPDFQIMTIKDILDYSKTSKGEGFMVMDYETKEYLFKLKTPHYLLRKFFARSKNVNALFNSQNADEEMSALILCIKENLGVEEFMAMEEQDRLKFISEYYSL